MPLSISDEKIELIKLLCQSGKSNRKIAFEVGVHHRTVALYLFKLGLRCNTANASIDKVSETEARCKKCNDVKPLIEFQYGRKGQKYEYKFAYCNVCRKEQTYLNLNNNIDKYLSDRFSRMKRRCNSNNIDCDLTKEQFIQQYHKQGGLCFYTDVKLFCQVGSDLQRNSFSIDRIFPERGYILGNIVFTTHRINTCKNDLSLDEIKKWMPLWYERIINFLTAQLIVI